jgi:pimeloyl-ACP methyl ester carboxylesterase
MPSRLLIPAILVAAIATSALTAFAVDRPESATFSAKGVNIHYLIQGQGQPVVLIHGLHASAEMNWNLPGVMAELAKDHQVIAIDMPGHGRSDKPTDDKAYGKEIVEDVLLLLDHLKIKRAHIVGYSLGGMVAMKFLSTHPDRALSGTIGGMGWLRDGSALQDIWQKAPERDGSRTPSAFIHTIGHLALTKDELLGIKVPVKIIVGDRDPVKRLYIVPLQAARSDWPVAEIPDSGHINCILKSQFRDEIAIWVRRNSKP